MLGWEVVVKKEEFKVGDLAIYFSIDSILENNPNTGTFKRELLSMSDNLISLEFLANKPLKTRKIRGVLSQGLVAPLVWLVPYGVDPSSVKEGYLNLIDLSFKAFKMIHTFSKCDVGDDVTAIMNVKKWIPKEEEEVYSTKDSGNSKANYPEFIPKTNEERVQNIANELEYFRGSFFSISFRSQKKNFFFITELTFLRSKCGHHSKIRWDFYHLCI